MVELRDPAEAILRVTNYYDPLPDNPRFGGVRLNAQQRRLGAELLNTAICSGAAAHGIACADVYVAFKGGAGEDSPWRLGLLLPDGVHPSDDGQRRIAAALRGTGYAPLARSPAAGPQACTYGPPVAPNRLRSS